MEHDDQPDPVHVTRTRQSPRPERPRAPTGPSPVEQFFIAYLEDAIRELPFGSPDLLPLLRGLAAWRGESFPC